MTQELLSLFLTWISFFMIAYAGFCIYWGTRQSHRANTSMDFFVAGRSLPPWVFIMTLTTASFAGWIFIALPGLVLRDGFPAAYLAFSAVVVPLGGVFFLKRQWMLGCRFGFITPGEMYSTYYHSELPRFFTVLLALLFAIPLTGILLGAAGMLLSTVTEGWLSREAGMWLLATLTLIYVSAGGMRALAYVCTLQALLIAGGVVILGFAALSLTGGMDNVSRALAEIAASPAMDASATNGFGGGNFKSWFAVSGVVQFTSGLEREIPAGGFWTGAMILSFLLAFLGVQMSPVFSMLAFSMTDTRGLAAQQVWYGAFGVGLLLFLFATLQGVSAYVLGADPNVSNAGLALANYFPDLSGGWHGQVVATLIQLVAQAAPWLAAILTVCATVALTATCGVYLLTSSAVLSRDVFVAYFNYDATDRSQIMFSRVIMLILAVAALVMATFTRDGMVALGALGIALSLQLFPALAGVTWLPWLHRNAVNAGLLTGSATVLITGEFGQYLAGDALPWGQSPWTIYPAMWGLTANVVTCLGVSLFARPTEGAAVQTLFRRFFEDHDRAAALSPNVLSAAWVAFAAWVFFAIGPGSVFGNWAFGRPDGGLEVWDFQIPSIWAWQFIWWGIGVLLVWFLANGLRLSSPTSQPIQALANDVVSLREPTSRTDRSEPSNASERTELRV